MTSILNEGQTDRQRERERERKSKTEWEQDKGGGWEVSSVTNWWLWTDVL